MPKQSIEEFLELAKKRLKRCIDADRDNRADAIKDKLFINGDSQWEAQEKSDRAIEGRPALQANLLVKYINQLTGEERHNKSRIKVEPSDFNADAHTARLREGIISGIEYDSNADAIYSQAYEGMLEGTYGAWRYLTRYCEDNPFVQEVYMKGIPNALQVYFDPASVDPCFADAKYAFVLTKIPKEEFEDTYPNAEVPGEVIPAHQGISNDHWWDKDTITVAEYFIRDIKITPMCQMDDGTVLTESDAKQRIKVWDDNNKKMLDRAQTNILLAAETGTSQSPSNMQGQPPKPVQPGPQQQPQQQGAPLPQQQQPQPEISQQPMEPRPKIVKRRDTEETVIKHYIITALGILDPTGGENEEGEKIDPINGNRVPGKYIPIVLLTGRKRNIEGKTYCRSFIRDCKDPMKMFNWVLTAIAEYIGLAPKAPWLATPKMVEGHETEYGQANIKNYPILLYNSDESFPGAKPERQAPAQVPSALIAQLQVSKDIIKDVIGMFNSDMGDVGPERTGAAITARQRPGDIGSFPFLDELNRAKTHGGKIANSMIPEVYDTERDVRVRTQEETDTFVPINTTVKNALQLFQKNPERFRSMNVEKIKEAIKDGEDAKFNDISIGKYRVYLKTGPAYATARQETADLLFRMYQADPQTMKLVVDILFEYLDFNGSEKAAKRFRKTLPPGLVEPEPGDPPAKPMQPSPQAQLLMMKGQTEQIKQQKESLKAKVELIKLYKETNESDKEIKSKILDVLDELFATQHPADTMNMPNMQPRQ